MKFQSFFFFLFSLLSFHLIGYIQATHDAHNKSFLSTYWRELGIAWNHSNGTKLWGAPFKDCGPLKGRWLWPFSMSVVEHGYKYVFIYSIMYIIR